MKEIYKNLGFLGYPNYEVSNLGNVKSLNGNGKERILRPAKRGSGYLFVILSKNGKTKHYSVHRLVAEAFIPNPYNLSQVNHKDEIKTNNNYLNLEWCTASYNVNYGTRNAKISKPVKQFDLKGNFIRNFSSTKEVERKFGYASQNISSACIGKIKQAYGYRWSYN